MLSRQQVELRQEPQHRMEPSPSLCRDGSHPDGPDQPLEDREGIGCFSPRGVKTLDKSDSSQACFGSQSEGTVHNGVEGNGDRSVRQLVTWRPHSGSREIRMLRLSSPRPFYAVWGPRLMGRCIQGMSTHVS